jgi:hypothetical protein
MRVEQPIDNFAAQPSSRLSVKHGGLHLHLDPDERVNHRISAGIDRVLHTRSIILTTDTPPAFSADLG